MKNKLWLVLISLIFCSFIFGCTRVRTYTVEDERVDQDLKSGNMGYLSGAPSEAEKNAPRKLTRKHYVAEVEIGQYKRSKKSKMTVEKVEEPVAEPIAEPIAEQLSAEPVTQQASVQKFTTYTVLPNDTLGKISVKVYGTAKKWKQIFEANSDKLKSPDKIYEGQELKIP